MHRFIWGGGLVDKRERTLVVEVLILRCAALADFLSLSSKRTLSLK